jgi:Putative, 10TM heavy-metal exporter
LSNLKNISLPRGTLLGGLLLIILGIITGEFKEGIIPMKLDWEQIIFLLFMALGIFIIVTVSEHFLEDHLWKHLVKKHFLRIFLWTFGALLFIKIFNTYLHWETWIQSNQLLILLLALIIGVIPESGPHLIFVTLFMSGIIPFSTLLASAIVQDGHGSLPLLAESKKSFLLAKGINIFIGLIVGLAGLYFFK